LLQDLGEGLHPGWQAKTRVVAHTVIGRIGSGENGAVRGQCERALREHVLETSAFPGELIEDGSRGRSSVGPESIGAKSVDRHQKHTGGLARPDGRATRKRERENWNERSIFQRGRLPLYKYIEAPRPELYDLKADPGETRNLFDTDRERALSMRSRLLSTVEALPSSLSARHQPDPETIERLRALGYAASGGVLLGNLLWQSGDLEGAESSFREALERDPDFARAHRRLGELYFSHGDREKALASFGRAAELAPEDIATRLGIARSLKASGDTTAAMKELEALHGLHPDHPAVLSEYAGTLAQQGDPDRALALLAKGPDHTDIHYTRSVILRSKDRIPEALAELDRALALAPESAVSLHDRGVILSRKGRLEEAVLSLQKALQIQESPFTRNALGTALCRMDRCAEGVPHFERAVASAPNFVDALDNLAQAYALLGRTRESREVQERAYALRNRRKSLQ
jgi:tetratricopeptide (TPR) repeat protein